jgi:hypothetical protein
MMQRLVQASTRDAIASKATLLLPVSPINHQRLNMGDLLHASTSKFSIIVATRTGGQGKTLVSQVIHFIFKECGEPLKVMAADTAGDNGSATKSKLARFLEAEDVVEELGIGATIQSIRSNTDEMLKYWVPLAQGLVEGNVLVDVGANVLPAIWEWAVEIDAGRVLREAPPIWLVIPVTAQAQSLSDSCDLIRLAEAKQKYLPVAKYIVVFNEHEGKFDRVSDTAEYQSLMKLISDVKASTISLERCKTSVWQKMQVDWISLKAMRNLTYRDYSSRFGLSSFMGSAAEKDFVGWLFSTAKAFQAASLYPKSGMTN